MTDEKRRKVARRADRGEGDALVRALADRLRRGEVPAIEVRFAARRGDATARAVLGAEAPELLETSERRGHCEAGCPTLERMIVELVTGARRLALPAGECALELDVDGDRKEWKAASPHAVVDLFAREFWDEWREDAEPDFEIIAEEGEDGIEGEDPEELTPRLFLAWWWASKGEDVCACRPEELSSLVEDPGRKPILGGHTMPPVFDAQWVCWPAR